MDEPGATGGDTGNPGDTGSPGTGDLPGWAAALPDDLKTNGDLTGFQKVGDLAGAYLEERGKRSEAEGKLANAVIRPGEGATDEDRGAFLDALGRPKDPAEYDLKPNLPEGVTPNEDIIAGFRATAHEAGLTQDQAAQVHDWFNSQISGLHGEIQGNIEARREEALNKLREDWGDSLDGNIETAKRFLFTFADPDVLEFLDTSGLGDNPTMIRFLHKAGKAILDDKIVKGDLVSLESGKVNRNPVTGHAQLSYPSMQKK